MGQNFYEVVFELSCFCGLTWYLEVFRLETESLKKDVCKKLKYNCKYTLAALCLAPIFNPNSGQKCANYTFDIVRNNMPQYRIFKRLSKRERMSWKITVNLEKAV